MQPSVFRRLQIATFAFLALVVVGLVISAVLTALELRYLRNVQGELAELQEFDSHYMVVTRRLTLLAEGTRSSPHGRPQLSHVIDRMIALSDDAETPDHLRALRARLEDPVVDRVELAESFTLITAVGRSARAREAELIDRLERQTTLQLRLEMAAPLAIVAAGILLVPFARKRIIKPLNAFGQQLSRLADGVFTPAPVDEKVDPFLLPLHRQFNVLAQRLQELEAAHHAREVSLEASVRAATHQLLEQQRGLARAERLAATGELAASVGHELRNPLAGLQMTLVNIRAELRDAELAERVDLMIHEVERLTRLLNGLLDAARHAPEPARPIRLAELIDEMYALTRYQLAVEIRLENRVDAGLSCRLPQDRLRQALLNLILNAAGALAGRAGEIAIGAAVEGETLRVIVSDDGPGFPPEVLDSGIRPFFSTREQGTGLGLAMVRRFARDIGGSVELANRTPHGAQVTLVLPSDADGA